MKFGMQVGLGPGHIGTGPQFSAHVYCGQMVGWIKMALGMEVGLGPGHIVLDGWIKMALGISVVTVSETDIET